jgi:hypothetical protein
MRGNVSKSSLCRTPTIGRLHLHCSRLPQVRTALLMFVAVAFWACSAGPVMSGATAPERPKWTAKTGGQKKGKRFYVGRSSGLPRSDDGYEMAANDALRAVVRELGITVQEESRDIQRERNGEYSYLVEIRLSTQSKPVRLAGVHRAKIYQETWERPGVEYDSWVLLAVPVSELEKARRQIAGKVLLAWNCTSDTAGTCDRALLEPIANVATTGGHPLIPEPVQPAAGADLAALGARNGAAWVISVAMEAGFAEESHGEFYATGRGTIQLVDTGDGKVVLSLDSGAVKGGEFSRDKAVQQALDNVSKGLAGKLREASGF